MSELMKGGKKEKKTKVVKSKKTKPKIAKKENPWLTHVKKTMKDYPNKKFKEVLIFAKKTYTKK